MSFCTFCTFCAGVTLPGIVGGRPSEDDADDAGATIPPPTVGALLSSSCVIQWPYTRIAGNGTRDSFFQLPSFRDIAQKSLAIRHSTHLRRRCARGYKSALHLIGLVSYEEEEDQADLGPEVVCSS